MQSSSPVHFGGWAAGKQLCREGHWGSNGQQADCELAAHSWGEEREGLGPDDFKKFLPTETILWFFSYMKRYTCCHYLSHYSQVIKETQ